VPLKGEDGRPVRWVGTLTEIEERKQAELRLQQAVASLEAANADLDRFAAVVAHDLQEPLRTIAAFSGLLTRNHGEQLDAQGRECVQFIGDAAIRATDLVRGLLSLAQIGRQSLQVKPVALDEALDTACVALRVAIEESQARIVRDRLPHIQGDRALLAQVFQNLMANALKFRAASPPEIHVAGERVGDEWVVSVRDNGIGFDSRSATRIFEPFSRLRSEQPGIGIGLAISRKIVERHGGRIWAEGEPGAGATFRFTLPGANHAPPAA
jgi:light-regulated signal transduction histidine kinase (bacteriophytochrome)